MRLTVALVQLDAGGDTAAALDAIRAIGREPDAQVVIAAEEVAGDGLNIVVGAKLGCGTF